MSDLHHTALHAAHLAAAARIVPFAGWEMPVQYAGVIEEVRAVRQGCGVFDVSHMGQLDIRGHGVTTALNGVVSADWSRVRVGRVAYALLLNQSGGVIDDIMGYRLGEEHWLIVANASRAPVDEAHLRSQLPAFSIANRYANQAMLAIQGAESVAVLSRIASIDLAQLPWRDCRRSEVAGAEGLLARGGYTGADGFEFIFGADAAETVWQALLQAGVVPCGLGARDVLRLEAGLPLYGHELREEWTPFESGCGWAVKFDKGDFMGRATLEGRRSPSRRIRALKMQSKAIPREGYAVVRDGEPIGEVTSGTLSPTVGTGIALAMLPAELASGETVEVQVRQLTHPAEVVKPPFVPHAPK